MQVVKVPLGDRSYDIRIGAGLIARLGVECGRLGLGWRCAVITDRHVGAQYGETAMASLRAEGFEPVQITVRPGEKSKSLRTVEVCYGRLAAHRLERSSFVVALGGGVVGDMAGYVAATYLRGLAFVQVPTTLLAQVDSSVGGKVGVNLPAGKNLVGAFHQPRLVLCDLETLTTLPERELRAGLAEVIKYGIIRDAGLFRRLERDLERLLERDAGVLGSVVARCCAIKAEVVSEDETESGVRAILNFGHTIGHAIEAVTRYGEYLHGEAIAIGQVLAGRLSADLLNCPLSDVERMRALFVRAGLPTQVRLGATQRRRMLSAMRLDKKVSAGVIRFVLAKRIGEVVHGQPVAAPVVEHLLATASVTPAGQSFLGRGASHD